MRVRFWERKVGNMMDKMYRCVVLLATYNGESYIKDQINSIFSQENVDVTVLFRDDGSTDNTVSILNSIAGISQIKDNYPRNCGSASNFLILASRMKEYTECDYIFFADQDDIWLPNKMSAAIKKLNSGYSAYSGSFYQTNQYCDELSKKYVKKGFRDKQYGSLFRSPGPGFTFAFKADTFREIINSHYFANYFPMGTIRVKWHDWFIFCVAMDLGLNWYIDDEPYALYRIHSNNDTGRITNISTLLKRIKFALSGDFIDESFRINQFRKNEKMLQVYNNINKFWTALSRTERPISEKLFILLSYIVYRRKRRFK